jgi:hypothetical protein
MDPQMVVGLAGHGGHCLMHGRVNLGEPRPAVTESPIARSTNG